ncbi:hypothetical protein VTL71DRAFT_11647 [Oculimacula yallundae]|uniref:Uncharacterized protein n=1 Tax=Oculimacula yallundae TaxID=86028 RepID=A0ABR4CT93_9HELO
MLSQLFRSNQQKPQSDLTNAKLETEVVVIVYWFLIRLISMQSSSIAMDFNVQPERGKSSHEPKPRRHPIIMKSRPSENPTSPKENLQLLAGVLSTLGSLLWQEVLVNVWQDTTLCDCDVSEKLVQLLIVADGELEMARDDTGLLVITGGVTSQLEDFGGQVFEDSSEVNWGT